MDVTARLLVPGKSQSGAFPSDSLSAQNALRGDHSTDLPPLLPVPLPATLPHIAVSVDTMVDGVHFDARTTPFDLGHKALAVNLSDMAGMGATPLAASLALSRPATLSADWVRDFAAGLLTLADEFQLNWRGTVVSEGPLTITVEIIGGLPDPGGLYRSGARAGDIIFVSGHLGDAGAALAFLPQPARDDVGKAPTSTTITDAEQRALAARLFRPTPRVALGVALRGIATAAMDLSDGLNADLRHILRASGVVGRVNPDRLPISPALAAYAGPVHAPEFAVASGDDYELVFTVPPESTGRATQAAKDSGTLITCVGTVVAPSEAGRAPGELFWENDQGATWNPPPGYGHFLTEGVAPSHDETPR